MPNPVTHFEVVGKDGKKLQEFYSKVFEWKIDADNPMQYGMVSAVEPGGIAGGISGTMGDMQPHGVTFYVEVPNLESALRDVEAAGGKTVMPASDVPGGPRIAMFTDPEGHLVGLTQAGSMQANQN